MTSSAGNRPFATCYNYKFSEIDALYKKSISFFIHFTLEKNGGNFKIKFFFNYLDKVKGENSILAAQNSTEPIGVDFLDNSNYISLKVNSLRGIKIIEEKTPIY